MRRNETIGVATAKAWFLAETPSKAYLKFFINDEELGDEPIEHEGITYRSVAVPMEHRGVATSPTTDKRMMVFRRAMSLLNSKIILANNEPIFFSFQASAQHAWEFMHVERNPEAVALIDEGKPE